MALEFESGGDGFYVDEVIAIYRWHAPLVTRAGTYRVVAMNAAYELVRMIDPDFKLEAHPTCVVDDFGDLQKVPA